MGGGGQPDGGGGGPDGGGGLVGGGSGQAAEGGRGGALIGALIIGAFTSGAGGAAVLVKMPEPADELPVSNTFKSIGLRTYRGKG